MTTLVWRGKCLRTRPGVRPVFTPWKGPGCAAHEICNARTCFFMLTDPSDGPRYAARRKYKVDQ